MNTWWVGRCITFLTDIDADPDTRTPIPPNLQTSAIESQKGSLLLPLVKAEQRTAVRSLSEYW